jgi:hypothetical protein
MSEESSDLPSEAELRATAEELDQFLPFGELISIPAAFEFAKQVASRLDVPGYKTERLLIRALRRENLITTLQGPANAITHRDWVDESRKIKSPGFPSLKSEEFTSKPAIEELFKRNAARRRRLDRERRKKLRAKQSHPNKKFKNLSRKAESERQTEASKKRTSNRKKRTR